MRQPIESLNLMQAQLKASGCKSDYDWPMYTYAFQTVLKKIKTRYKGTPKCKIINWSREDVLRFLEEGSDRCLLSHYQTIAVNLYFDSKIEPKPKTSLGPVIIKCTYCNSTASLHLNDNVYACDKGCDARVGYHKGDLMPLGILANEKLRKLRQVAFYEIETYAKNSGYTLKEAFLRIAEQMKIQYHEVKIARLNAQQCTIFLRTVRYLQNV